VDAAHAKGEEMAAKLGFDDIRETTELEAALSSMAGEGTFLTPLAPEEYEATSRDDASSFEAQQTRDAFDGRKSRTQQFKTRLEEVVHVHVADLTSALDYLRGIKTPEEIEAMRMASKIAAAGHIASMRATKPGMKEWQIGAEATAAFYRLGAPAVSYFPIVGTGRNALILHYTDTGATVQPNDVILMDYAPEWHFYASDVTRSWPASGKFSPEAKKIYEAVLHAQEAGIAAVKPGVSFMEVNKAAMETLQKEGFSPFQYMPHGLSHPIGMTTHDVGGLGRLEPGMVFTVEPGIYDAKSGIGVRIEDVVAVTKDGVDVLSKDAPKQVAELEAIVGKPQK
jgi:Xaa-Pro aminopeptidase